jgi:hypothetical protein
MTKADLENKLAKANKEIASLKNARLVDILAASLTTAGIKVEGDSVEFDDDYLSFHLYSADKETRYSIAFSFNEDASLRGVRMFSCKKLHGYDEDDENQCGWSTNDLREKAKWEQEKKNSGYNGWAC